MKILTLKQPWASLIAAGHKKYEFRSWKTNYRGLLLIHAGMGVENKNVEKFSNYNLDSPKSEIMCLVDLKDCILINEEVAEKLSLENQFVYGSKEEILNKGYAWEIEVIKILKIPNVKGKLGLWNYEWMDENE